MIYVGIDDTDTLETPGTNQLAKVLVATVAADFRCHLILRHQLFSDPRVHYTSKNGSASIWLERRRPEAPCLPDLIHTLRQRMLDWYVPGSDPGLTATEFVPPEVTEYGLRCKRELMNQEMARVLAAQHGIYLEGLGGTEGGVIGALAAIGLAAGGDDGRVVVWQDYPDDLEGPQPIERIRSRDIHVRNIANGDEVLSGTVDVGKHLRPNYRQGQVVLFAEQVGDDLWQGIRLL